MDELDRRVRLVLGVGQVVGDGRHAEDAPARGKKITARALGAGVENDDAGKGLGRIDTGDGQARPVPAGVASRCEDDRESDSRAPPDVIVRQPAIGAGAQDVQQVRFEQRHIGLCSRGHQSGH